MPVTYTIIRVNTKRYTIDFPAPRTCRMIHNNSVLFFEYLFSALCFSVDDAQTIANQGCSYSTEQNWMPVQYNTLFYFFSFDPLFTFQRKRRQLKYFQSLLKRKWPRATVALAMKSCEWQPCIRKNGYGNLYHSVQNSNVRPIPKN